MGYTARNKSKCCPCAKCYAFTTVKLTFTVYARHSGFLNTLGAKSGSVDTWLVDIRTS